MEHQLSMAEAGLLQALIAERERFLGQNDAALADLAALIAGRAGLEGGNSKFERRAGVWYLAPHDPEKP